MVGAPYLNGSCDLVPCPALGAEQVAELSNMNQLFLQGRCEETLPGVFCDTRGLQGYDESGYVLCELGGNYSLNAAQQVPCPDHAGGFPNCACLPGFSGTLDWSPELHQWQGACLLVPCPDWASSAITGQGSACACDTGFELNVSSTPLQWQEITRTWTVTQLVCPLVPFLA